MIPGSGICEAFINSACHNLKEENLAREQASRVALNEAL